MERRTSRSSKVEVTSALTDIDASTSNDRYTNANPPPCCTSIAPAPTPPVLSGHSDISHFFSFLVYIKKTINDVRPGFLLDWLSQLWIIS